jgi:hypothetical protein
VGCSVVSCFFAGVLVCLFPHPHSTLCCFCSKQLAAQLAAANPVYVDMIASWQEQRDWGLNYALEALRVGGSPLATAIAAAWADIYPPPNPPPPSQAGWTPASPGSNYSVGRWTLAFDSVSGALSTLVDSATGQAWARPDDGSFLGLLQVRGVGVWVVVVVVCVCGGGGGRLVGEGAILRSEYRAISALATLALLFFPLRIPLLLLPPLRSTRPMTTRRSPPTSKSTRPSRRPCPTSPKSSASTTCPRRRRTARRPPPASRPSGRHRGAGSHPSSPCSSSRTRRCTSPTAHLSLPASVSRLPFPPPPPVRAPDSPLPPPLEWDVPAAPQAAALNVSLSIYGKAPTRLLEGLFLRFNASAPAAWAVDKLGSWVDPFDVVSGGNQHHHGTWAGVAATAAGGAQLVIGAPDSGIACFGPPTVFPTPTDRGAVNASAGASFLLIDNLWSTNYPMWIPWVAGDENERWRFTLTVQ